MRPSPTVLPAFACIALCACPTEDIPIADPGPFFPDATVVTVADATVGIDILSGAEYVPTVRNMLSGCATCHGPGASITPFLHTYVTARNALTDTLRALDRGHDGDYSRLLLRCGTFAGVTGLGDEGHFVRALAQTLESWRAGGFRPGPPVSPDTPDALPPAAHMLTLTPITSATPRCYRLGTMEGRISRMRVTAVGLAWVELFAVAPPLSDRVPELEAADAAPGWDCGDDLALVPQPLVGAWQYGDEALDLTTHPVLIPLSTLVARVDSSFFAPPPTGPAATIDLWTDATTNATLSFVPLATPSGLELPWLDAGGSASVAAAYSTGSTAWVALPPSQCVHQRTSIGEWPQIQTGFASGRFELSDGARLELVCHDGAPCAAQLGVVGDAHAEPCPASIADCRATCADDLDCLWPCVAQAGRRCSTCLLVGQLACRSDTCVTTARDRLESCSGADDPTTCIGTTVLDALSGCPEPALCDDALAACFPAP